MTTPLQTVQLTLTIEAPAPTVPGACGGGMELQSLVREGVLSTTTFPGLVYSILSRKETGVLSLTGDTSEKSIYIQSGRPVFATSNDRDDRLGQIFFKTGLVSLEGLMGSLERAAEEGKRLGTVLVEQGLIQPHDLVEG